jgi:hypothetical protein
MTKIFLPPLDSRWRLLGDYATDDRFRAGDNAETMTGDTFSTFYHRFTKSDPNPGHTTPEYAAWEERYTEAKRLTLAEYGFDGVIPAGTLLQIERYHISRSGTNQVTTKVLLSPSKFLTPKKHKGVMRGSGRLYFTLDQFNLLPDLEPFTETLA